MSEKNKVVRTYRLSKSTLERLEALAEQQAAWPSPLVDLLLQRALDEIEVGCWTLQRTPTRYEHHW